MPSPTSILKIAVTLAAPLASISAEAKLTLPTDYAYMAAEDTTLNCRYAGMFAEDHFDIGMSMGFGLCEDTATAQLHYLAVPSQLDEFNFGDTLELQVRPVQRTSFATAVESALAFDPTVDVTDIPSSFGATTANHTAYAITRIVSTAAPLSMPASVAGMPAPTPTTTAAAVGSSVERRSFLAIRLNYDDYTNNYCSDQCVLDGFTKGLPRAEGTVEHQIEVASYEKVEWTHANAVTINMGESVSAIRGCNYLPATQRALSLMATQHPGVSTDVDHIEIWVPERRVSQCGWGGLGRLGGPFTWEHDASVSGGVANNGIRVHELGHNLRLHHSGRMDAQGNILNEYGDYSAPMGSSLRTNAPGFIMPNLITLGWLDLAAHTTEWTDNAVVTIEDLRTDPVTNPNGVYGVRLLETGTNMAVWLSLRSGAGLDATLSSDVKWAISVHYAQSAGQGAVRTYSLGFAKNGIAFPIKPTRNFQSTCGTMRPFGCEHVIKLCGYVGSAARVALAAATTEATAMIIADNLCLHGVAPPTPPWPPASPPPSPPTSSAVTLLHFGRACHTQSKNLGTTFTTPLECALAADADASCPFAPTTIMWSLFNNRELGCRCCASADGDPSINVDWSVYQVVTPPAPALPPSPSPQSPPPLPPPPPSPPSAPLPPPPPSPPSAPLPPPPPSPPSAPPPSSSGPGVCGETCNYSSDGDCDDGGAGAEYTYCTLGSDCFDCGVRGGAADTPPPSPPAPSAPPPPPSAPIAETCTLSAPEDASGSWNWVDADGDILLHVNFRPTSCHCIATSSKLGGDWASETRIPLPAGDLQLRVNTDAAGYHIYNIAGSTSSLLLTYPHRKAYTSPSSNLAIGGADTYTGSCWKRQPSIPTECWAQYPNMAGQYTCGDRISWLMATYGMPLLEARHQVATEFPEECGACTNVTPPSPPPYPLGLAGGNAVFYGEEEEEQEEQEAAAA